MTHEWAAWSSPLAAPRAGMPCGSSWWRGSRRDNRTVATAMSDKAAQANTTKELRLIGLYIAAVSVATCRARGYSVQSRAVSVFGFR